VETHRDERHGVDTQGIAPGSLWRILPVYGVVAVLALLPIFAVTDLPLADLPNHLARAHILDALGTSADLQRHYVTDWRPLSFQSTDLLLPLLTHLFGVFLAGRIYTALAFVLLLSGTAALHRALFGHWSLWPAAGALFCFDLALAWGFVGYLFAMGLLLLLLADWIVSEDVPPLRRTLRRAAGAVLLLLCHFFAFATFAVLIAVMELERALRSREAPMVRVLTLLLAALPFLEPALITLAALDLHERTLNAYGSFGEQVIGLLSPLILYFKPVDFVIALAGLGALWLAARRRLLTVAPALRLPLLVIAIVGVAMPTTVSSIWGANFRIPCLLPFLLIGGSDLALDRTAVRRSFIALLVALLGLRAATTLRDWQHYAAEYAAFRSITPAIARGSRVLAVPGEAGCTAELGPLFPYQHIPLLAVIDRDAYVPSLFTLAMPVRFRENPRNLMQNYAERDQMPAWQPSDPAFARADAATRAAVETLAGTAFWADAFASATDWSRWPEDFDYLVTFTCGAAQNPVPALLTEAARAGHFTLYRIHPPG
jgi:hypothetical protein